jgi:uncharacterized protein DUF6580
MRLPRLLLIALLILVPAFMRAIHFERSIVPMGALALFCGAHFRNRWLALGIPLASMLGGDVLIGLFHHDMRFGFHFLMPVIYGCYALNVLMGMGLQRYWDRIKSVTRRRGETNSLASDPDQRPSVFATHVLPIAATTLAEALLFYLVTNFADWYYFNSYAKTWQGLVDCYVAAIPFFRRGTLLADILGSVLLFGGEYLLQHDFVEQPETERA